MEPPRPYRDRLSREVQPRAQRAASAAFRREPQRRSEPERGSPRPRAPPAPLTLQAEAPQGRADSDRGGNPPAQPRPPPSPRHGPSPRGPSPPGRGRCSRRPAPAAEGGKGLSLRPAQRSPAAAGREAAAVGQRWSGRSAPGAATPSSSSSFSSRRL